MSLQRRCFGPSRSALPSATMLVALPRQPPPRPDSKATAATSNIITATPSAHLPTLPTTAATTDSAVASAAGQAAHHRPAPDAESLQGAAQTLLPHPGPRCLSIVTGASRGLGAAIARVLAARGAPLPPVPAAPLAAGRETADGSFQNPMGGCPTAPGAAPAAASTPSSFSPSPSPSPPVHDLILLASDSAQLRKFVRTELAPLLERQQEQQQRVKQTSAEREQERERIKTLSLPPLQQQQGEVAVAAVQIPAQPTLGGGPPAITRIRTACFDLGELEHLEVHTSRLMSPDGAAAAASPSDAGSTSSSGGGGEGGSVDGLTAASLPPSGSSATVPIAAGATAAASSAAGYSGGGGGGNVGDGGGGCNGLLPLPPAAYSHVLLIHNAGQVGDLAPLELQGLANIRRQTDLNVTSFAYLTAAVLRTFLYTPLLELEEGVEVGDVDGTGGQVAGAVRPAGLQAHRHRRQRQLSTRALDDGPPEGKEEGKKTEEGGQRGPGVGVGSLDVSEPSSAQAGAAVAASESPLHQQQQQQLQRERQQQRVITVVNISSVSVDKPYEHFSLYGMGKAARHMIIRSVAHEAALRDVGELAPGAEAVVGLPPVPSAAALIGHPRDGPAPVARVRALSFAPGAIDTEMQSAAREALPAGPLKDRFEDNARCDRLVDPWVSAQVLYDILAADEYDNGGHVDYYSAAVGSSHPLAHN